MLSIIFIFLVHIYFGRIRRRTGRTTLLTLLMLLPTTSPIVFVRCCQQRVLSRSFVRERNERASGLLSSVVSFSFDLPLSPCLYINSLLFSTGM